MLSHLNRHRVLFPLITCSSLSYRTRLFHAGLARRNEHTDKVSTDKDKQLEGPEISDEEWGIRAGRAISVLRETLPNFFKTGLVERIIDEDHVESIYSSRIQLIYTPPSLLPPFPPTLTIEGLPLYHASSVFVRHTLSMFYTDLKVDLKRVHEQKLGARERKFLVGFAVLGTSRMGNKPAEWDILSTYHISPTSGQIYKHVVESIRPAPHSSIYESLASALSRLSGFKPGSDPPVVPGGVQSCTVRATNEGRQGPSPENKQ